MLYNKLPRRWRGEAVNLHVKYFSIVTRGTIVRRLWVGAAIISMLELGGCQGLSPGLKNQTVLCHQPVVPFPVSAPGIQKEHNLIHLYVDVMQRTLSLYEMPRVPERISYVGFRL